MIRKTRLSEDDKQVNVRLDVSTIDELEALAEKEQCNRTDVLRTFIEDGLATYATEGALLPPDLQERMQAEADAAGVPLLTALQQASESWLRLRAALAEVERPRRFPSREVMAALAEKRTLLREMLGT